MWLQEELDRLRQWWLGLMFGAATGEPPTERGRKAAKRLEIGPSEREPVGSVVAVVVPGSLEERMTLVVHVVMDVEKRVDEIEVVWAGSQMPAAEVVLGRRVRLKLWSTSTPKKGITCMRAGGF